MHIDISLFKLVVMHLAGCTAWSCQMAEDVKPDPVPKLAPPEPPNRGGRTKRGAP